MFDCAIVEMRERLPELAAGALDAATRARVEAHVAACADCAAELETLRLVRAAYTNAPVVDVRRIVSALPHPPAVSRTASHAGPPVRRWMDWRIAAALTMITVGGLSVAVARRAGSPGAVDSAGAQTNRDSVVIASTAPSGAGNSGPAETVHVRRPLAPTRASSQKAQLSFGGGVDDLDRATIEALMGALDEIDRAPVAPSAEPDRTPVLPIISEGTR